MLRFKPCSGVFTHVTSSVYQSQHGLVHVNKIRTLWWRSAVMSLNANFRPPETALSARSSAAGVCAPPTWRSCANSDLPTSKNYFGKHYRPPKLQTTLPTCSDDVHMRQAKTTLGSTIARPSSKQPSSRVLMMCTCESCRIMHACELVRARGTLQCNMRNKKLERWPLALGDFLTRQMMLQEHLCCPELRHLLVGNLVP